MSLTTFGKAIRSARVQAETTLQEMADELQTSPAFLSAIETGRKKVPDQWINKIDVFFSKRNVRIEKLHELAIVANGQVSISGLTPAQQMLMAGFARTNLDADQLKNFEKLLRSAMKG